MHGNERLRLLAEHSANFGFLLAHEPLLVSYGATAESCIYTDPNAALVKARQFGERLADALIVRMGLPRVGTRQVDKIRALNATGALTPQVHQVFEDVRRIGNRAVHEHYADARAALTAVRHCFSLGLWFHRALTGEREMRAFLAPEPAGGAADEELRSDLDGYRAELVAARTSLQGKISRLHAEQEARQEAEEQLAAAAADRTQLAALVAQLTEQVTVLETGLSARAENPPTVAPRQRDALVDRARRAAKAPLTELQTREAIDEMLTAAGWLVQDVADLDLVHHRGVAVRELVMASGRADYALFVDRTLVGVIEAKREGTSLSSVEGQSERYATGLTTEQRLKAWRTPLPLRYESTGVETWFTNALEEHSRARQVFGFHRPETVTSWMVQAEADPSAPTYRSRLRRRLPELHSGDLRPAQVDAIRGIESALAVDRPRALVQMATGAGKTYAAVTLAYRLLKHAGAGRVLFLVDRNTLGRQALAEFTNYVAPDDGRKISELYVVQRLTGSAPLASSNVVISTVQRLYSLLRGVEVTDADADDSEPDDGQPIEVCYNAAIPPETFDLIVVDECHRSIYGRWRQVLEYFDAHVVGLTATPVAQTVGFFHALVSEYTYQQAVADGVNVDFDVVRIRTELGERGGTIPAETVVPMRDRRTRRQRYQELDDDLIYTSSQLGRAVISKAQLRLVWDTFRAAVFTTIFPGRSTVPKTLVFAKDDNHAEEIVHLVREIFDKGNDFCVKITYTALDPEGLLARFRNSPELRIAVTVDMIATGTDVRPLECVFFLRDVQSWAYFEQMKGRGARTIDPAEFQAVTPDAERKDRFVIVDAVGVTDSPRVDAASMQRSGAAQVSLETLLRKAAKLELSVEQASTLASRLARLDQQLEPEERAELERVAGRPLRSITRGLVDAIDIDAQVAAGEEGGAAAQRALIEEAARPLAGNPELRQRILEIRRAHDIVYDEVNPDRIISVDAVSFDERNPKHTVESWRAWIAEHRDEIDALRVAFDSRDPAGAYAQLADLAARIGRPPHRWTPARLWEAYTELGLARDGGRHGVTELVSILRYELGMDAELRPYSSRVEQNLAAWLARQQQAGVRFTVDQHWWIDRMAHVVVSSLGVTADDLDTVPFTDHGGVDGFLATFGDDRATALLDELNQELPA